jgi:hypothetical protein
MELPDDVLGLVRDFSRPLTRSDWRTVHSMNAYTFHSSILRAYNHSVIPVIERFVDNYDHNKYIYYFHNKPFVCLSILLE